MSIDWHKGNAAEDGRDNRGWFLGHFIDPAKGVRASNAVEVKWGIHPAGEKRSGWTKDDHRTTLVVMIEGSFRIDLTGGSSVTLAGQGDYVVWEPGVDHTWEALSDSVVMTVRWPSSP